MKKVLVIAWFFLTLYDQGGFKAPGNSQVVGPFDYEADCDRVRELVSKQRLTSVSLCWKGSTIPCRTYIGAEKHADE